MIAENKQYSAGVLLTLALAAFSLFVSGRIPGDMLGSSVLALVLGMFLHPVLEKCRKPKLACTLCPRPS